jgi:glutamate 5-kinase
MKNTIKRIAIKVGSNVLTRADGTPDVTRISHLVDQMAELRREGIDIILISSGAVASGRSEMKLNRKLDSVEQRQLFSAVGQAKLINRYYDLFREHGITVGQVLTTKESLSTRRSYLNQKSCMTVMLDNGVIPIVNENDTIAVSELMFTDNDELSGLVATMMDADMLIILSNIDGIYDSNPSEPDAKVIATVNPSEDISRYISSVKSGFGRGGMRTKAGIAGKVAEEGIEVVIANGKRTDILLQLIHSPQATPCTRFIPAKTTVSSVKKWIAHSEGYAKGAIHIDERASQMVRSDKAVSVLPVGITSVDGEFEKDDIIRIVDNNGELIGVGKADCDSEKVRENIGKHGEKAVVHYDYLYIE